MLSMGSQEQCCGNTDGNCRRIMACLSCRESSVRLSYQSLGPTANGKGEETADSKLDLLLDADRYDSSLLTFKYLI